MERERDREKETYRRALALRSINLFYVYFMVIILTFLFITRLFKMVWRGTTAGKNEFALIDFLEVIKKEYTQTSKFQKTRVQSHYSSVLK